MFGARLEVEAHIVTGSALSIQNLIKCVHSLEVQVDQLVLSPLAAGEAVLTPPSALSELLWLTSAEERRISRSLSKVVSGILPYFLLAATT